VSACRIMVSIILERVTKRYSSGIGDDFGCSSLSEAHRIIGGIADAYRASHAVSSGRRAGVQRA